MRRAEESDVDARDSVGDGSREHLAVVGRRPHARHRLPEQILTLPKGPKRRPRRAADVNGPLAHHPVREPAEETEPAAVERERGHRRPGRRREARENLRLRESRGGAAADIAAARASAFAFRGGGPQPDPSARRRREDVLLVRVPRGGAALARVLRDEIERRGRLGRAVHGPRPGRAVRRRRQHARRAGVKLRRPEPILRRAAGPGLVRLGLPREVVHRRAVARERRDLRPGRAVERPDDAHARLDARDGEPPAHRVERDEQSLPRRTRKVRLRASLPVGNLAIVQARAAVRKLDDRAPSSPPGVST